MFALILSLPIRCGVPRKNPVTSDEVEVGKRLRTIRKELLISRTAFALKLEISPERLASYESGRVPLPYGIGEDVVTLFYISPLWIALGAGTKVISEPSLYLHGLDQRRSLLEQIRDDLAKGRSLLPADVEPEDHRPSSPLPGKFALGKSQHWAHGLVCDYLSEILMNIPAAEAMNFVNEVNRAAQKLAARYRRAKR